MYMYVGYERNIRKKNQPYEVKDYPLPIWRLYPHGSPLQDLDDHMSKTNKVSYQKIGAMTRNTFKYS